MMDDIRKEYRKTLVGKPLSELLNLKRASAILSGLCSVAGIFTLIFAALMQNLIIFCVAFFAIYKLSQIGVILDTIVTETGAFIDELPDEHR